MAAGLRRHGHTVELRPVEDAGAPGEYDAVVLGSPVFDGRWMPAADAYADEHAPTLRHMPTWLFSVGSFGDTKRLLGPLALREPRNIASLRAVVAPRGYRVFAGVIDEHAWPLAARLLFRAVGGRFGDDRDWQQIDAWADEIADGVGSYRAVSHEVDADAWRRWVAAWPGGGVLGVVNGTAREKLYARRLGDARAHQLSTVTMLALLAGYFAALDARWPLHSRREAAAAGAGWAALTAAFEFGFGHWVAGEEWSELLADYDLSEGRLWSLVLAWTALGPSVVATARRHLRSR
jgi:menaquinone-dependent protoporphyrinogen IX oxidase